MRGPTWKIETMLGWFSAAAAWASNSKRCRRSGYTVLKRDVAIKVLPEYRAQHMSRAGIRRVRDGLIVFARAIYLTHSARA